MTDDVTYRCRECGQTFVRRQESEEHVVWNHDIFEEYIAVDDPANAEDGHA